MFSRNLSDAKVGSVHEVLSITEEKLSARLASFGVIEGSRITMINKTLFGNTIYIKTDRRRIAVRKKEARNILIR